jgi:hypothetical protein
MAKATKKTKTKKGKAKAEAATLPLILEGSDPQDPQAIMTLADGAELVDDEMGILEGDVEEDVEELDADALEPDTSEEAETLAVEILDGPVERVGDGFKKKVQAAPERVTVWYATVFVRSRRLWHVEAFSELLDKPERTVGRHELMFQDSSRAEVITARATTRGLAHHAALVQLDGIVLGA